MASKENLKNQGDTQKVWLMDVALPVPLKQTFTYRVPSYMEVEKMDRGRRVLVPFGHRVAFGVSWSGAYLLDDPKTAKKYRQLITYEEQPVILAPEIAKLVQWMDSYYHAPVGELLKLALPPGVLTRKEPVYKLTEHGRQKMQHIGYHPLACLQEKPLSKKAWSALAGENIKTSFLRQCEAENLIQPVFPGAVKTSTPRVKVVVLTEKGQAVTPSELAKTPRRAEIVAFLQRQERNGSLSQLKKQFPTLNHHLKKMIQAGLCRCEMQEAHLHEEIKNGNRGSRPSLKTQQQAVLNSLVEAVQQAEYQSFLLFGVTGSGKTEVYLRTVEACLEQGRQALLLVPEIALTPLMKERITQRFGDHLAILHSAIPKAERAANWARVLAGKVDVVLGARSGIFAPLPRLGLVIVDEEHDLSYKQSEGLRYHARDLAMVRAKLSGAVAVLGSATPSLESWHNAKSGKTILLQMRERATDAALPAVEIVDMRDEFKAQRKRPLISRLLQRRMKAALEQGEQVMLLLNRRGFYNFLLCRKCGWVMECHQCEVSLTYHKTDGFLHCHYCDFKSALPESCTACGALSTLMQFFGEGTQQVQAVLEQLFPAAVIDRLDRDRVKKKGDLEKVLERFRQGSTQILVGTQMIAKGHDFHNVTLVGIVNADQGLRVPDFRSAEHTFQLVTQVSGRSGRGDKPGSVVIQTYMPEHYSMTYAQSHDYPGFVTRELQFRHGLFYPPYSFLVNIVMQHQREDLIRQGAAWVVDFLKHHAKEHGLTILGPTRAPIGKIKRKFRYQILVKGQSRSRLNAVVKSTVDRALKEKLFPEGAIFLDVDPYHFS
ncbi:MAG: primosomal protein N' [Acidobacteria bacterium]|nr:MAG: primosomal protein N' [Acidobacteriota bacterium]